jgi:hypothetical protein
MPGIDQLYSFAAIAVAVEARRDVEREIFRQRDALIERHVAGVETIELAARRRLRAR